MGSIRTVQEVQRDQINKCVDAVCDRFVSAVRPIYGSDNRKLATHIGSATLLKVGGTPVIAVAAHIVDECKHTSLYIAGEAKLVPLEATFEATARPPGGRKNDRYDSRLVSNISDGDSDGAKL
jgi:hypothetical protein